MEHFKAGTDMKNVLVDSLNMWGCWEEEEKAKKLGAFLYPVFNPHNWPIMFTVIISM